MSIVSKYFKESEVTCKCGCGMVPRNSILAIADEIREGWGSGINVTSGARCQQYNMYLRMHGIPAALKSAHMSGIALDLKPVNGKITEFHNYVRSRLAELNIRMESPIDSPSWAHIDSRPVAPGKARVFRV